jgi:uncharacterized damage-inducible protein DinB
VLKSSSRSSAESERQKAEGFPSAFFFGYAACVNQDLQTFYNMVRQTRQAMFEWLEALPHEVFVQTRADFAFGSLQKIYTHIPECYLYWVEHTGLQKPWQGDPIVHTARDLRGVFARVDSVVLEALEQFQSLDEPLVWTSSKGQTEVLSQRWLLLHPMTHEFHHKGQAMALARVLEHPYNLSLDSDLNLPQFN